MGLLEKKVALVTGGSSGIGRAAAQIMAREGARVVVADIAQAGGEEIAALIRGNGREAVFIRADMAEAGEVEALIRRTVALYGRLDCALNNAGIPGDVAATADCTLENWERVMRVNLFGVWYCMKYEIPQMLKSGGGAIVNTSSISGLHGVRHQAAYSASKHGVIGLTKTAALEYGKAGIRVNALCPGWTISGMTQKREVHDVDPAFLSNYAVGRAGTPEEVAESAVWLCSDRASFVNGHALIVDGGRMAL
ncbi:MAG: glucose 1-dehydrogenase [Deltaproteobacteria bacterium]|nr:glucose 1-dehydrogenase [Deltaproteobacteria bacterium]